MTGHPGPMTSQEDPVEKTTTIIGKAIGVTVALALLAAILILCWAGLSWLWGAVL